MVIYPVWCGRSWSISTNFGMDAQAAALTGDFDTVAATGSSYFRAWGLGLLQFTKLVCIAYSVHLGLIIRVLSAVDVVKIFYLIAKKHGMG
jgi:hypothetical protein